MKDAIKEAEEALKIEEVPVGAVIVKAGKIIAKAHNLKETLKDPTAHAEILAIRKACEVLGDWRLKDCELYITLEPCAMCAAAIAQARIGKLYIGVSEPDSGACGSVVNLVQNDYLNYNVHVIWQYSEECSNMVSDFFKVRRGKNK